MGRTVPARNAVRADGNGGLLPTTAGAYHVLTIINVLYLLTIVHPHRS
jgi:hypothetical protein